MITMVYISGPMTGLPNYNFEAFNDAEAMLEAKGFVVVNPARFGDQRRSWEENMRMSLDGLLICEAIYFLPGWEQSRGAILEHAIAKELKIKTLTVEVLS